MRRRLEEQAPQALFIAKGHRPCRDARVSPIFRAALVQIGRSPSLASCLPVLAEGQVFTRAS